jgi:hypothetical protein
MRANIRPWSYVLRPVKLIFRAVRLPETGYLWQQFLTPYWLSASALCRSTRGASERSSATNLGGVDSACTRCQIPSFPPGRVSGRNRYSRFRSIISAYYAGVFCIPLPTHARLARDYRPHVDRATLGDPPCRSATPSPEVVRSIC